MTSSNQTKVLKFLVCGAPGVGKSTFVSTAVGKDVSPRHLTMVGLMKTMDHLKLNIHQSLYFVQLWHQEYGTTLESYRPTFFKGAHAMVFLFDTIDKSSAEQLSRWKRKIKEVYTRSPPYIIVGNQRTDTVDDDYESWIEESLRTDDRCLDILSLNCTEKEQVMEVLLRLLAEITQDGFCFSCFEEKDDLILQDQYFFCTNCSNKEIDMDKVKAFLKFRE